LDTETGLDIVNTDLAEEKAEIHNAAKDLGCV